jgi:hypothetical protein
MRTSSLLHSAWALCLSSALAACATTTADPQLTGDDLTTNPAPPVAPAPGTGSGAPVASTSTKITLKSTQPLKLVAFREVTDPVWHLATEETTGTFTAHVRGPYWMASVCEAAQIGAPQLLSQVWRPGRTLDDPHELDMPFLCSPTAPLPLPEVTGILVQPSAELGSVALSGATFGSRVQGNAQQFPFSILVPQGTYSMYGFDADRVAVRHGVVVDKSLPVFPFDLTIEGGAFASAAFDVVTDAPVAFVHEATRIEDAQGQVPFTLFNLPAEPFASPFVGRVVPNEVMTDDNQTVSVQADNFLETDNGDGTTSQRDENQSSRRPWRLGDDPTFVEPTQIAGASWSFDGRGQLIAHWQSLPALTVLTTEISGVSATGNFVDDFTEMSPAFVTATGLTSTLVDTSIPGFQPDWMVDYSLRQGPYTRNQLAQDIANLAAPEQAQISTSQITETVFASSPPAAASARAVIAPIAPGHLPRVPGLPYPN